MTARGRATPGHRASRGDRTACLAPNTQPGHHDTSSSRDLRDEKRGGAPRAIDIDARRLVAPISRASPRRPHRHLHSPPRDAFGRVSRDGGPARDVLAAARGGAHDAELPRPRRARPGVSEHRRRAPRALVRGGHHAKARGGTRRARDVPGPRREQRRRARGRRVRAGPAELPRRRRGRRRERRRRRRRRPPGVGRSRRARPEGRGAVRPRGGAREGVPREVQGAQADEEEHPGRRAVPVRRLRVQGRTRGDDAGDVRGRARGGGVPSLEPRGGGGGGAAGRTPTRWRASRARCRARRGASRPWRES